MNKQKRLFNRLKTDCLILPTPRLEGEELYSYMEYKLRALYPGNSGEYAISFYPLGKSSFTAVYACPKREIVSLDESVLPASLYVSSFSKKGNKTVMTLCSDWIDITIQSSGKSFESSALQRDEFRALQEQLEKEVQTDRIFEIFYTEIATLKPVLSIIKDLNPKKITLRKITGRMLNKGAPAFTNKQLKRPFPWARLLIITICFNLNFNLISHYKEYKSLDNQLSWLEEEYSNELKQRKELSVLKTRWNEKNAQWQDARNLIPSNRYQFFSDLHGIFGNEYEIHTLLISEKSFSMDVSGPDALSLKEKFYKDNRYTNIRISQVIPEDNIERFKLQGEYHD